MAVKEPTGDLKKACWKGYTAVGMKMKNGRKVPNCVPVKEESNEPKDREWGTTKLTKRYKKDTPGQCDCNTMKEEAEKQTHLVKVTVSEPSLKSAEPMLKGVRVRATSEGEAIKRAKSHFRKAGYKVHDAYHHSTITTVKKAGQMDERNDMWHPDPKVDSKMGGRAAAITQGKPTKKQMDLALLKRLAAAGKRIAAEEVEQISEGPQRDATRAKNKLKDAISGANYKRTGAPVPDAEPQHKTAQAHNKAIGRSLRKMEEGTRDLTAALAKKIEKKTGGKETAVRNKAGLLVPKKLKEKQEDWGHGKPEKWEKDYDYGGEPHGITVHDHTGERIDTISDHASKETAMKMARDRLRQHQINNLGKRGEIRQHGKVIHSVNESSHNATTSGIKKQPKAGIEKLVSKMNPDTKAKTVSETRNIIREVIKKAVDKQETNKANGKTATGEPMPKVQINPTIDLSTNGGPRGV